VIDWRGRQAVVFEERPPTKSGQVGGADHRHNKPAASRYSIVIVRDSINGLGVIFDSNLTFIKDHMAQKINKAYSIYIGYY